MQAKTIIQAVQEQLQDTSGIRWPAYELIEHMNDGQREIASVRPDQVAITVARPLAAGVRQTVPSDCSKLIEITRNTNGKSIRQVDRNLLEAIKPNWYSMAPSAVVIHVTRDQREPTIFHVYPPATTQASVDVTYAPLPAGVAIPSGRSYTSVTGDIQVPDVFKNALIDFCLFRAFAKDAEFGGNTQQGAAHYQLFKAAISDDAQISNAVKPTITDKPQ